MQQLEAFTYSLAHDLRAPVRAIRGYTQFALELPRQEVGPETREFLQRVAKAATRMDSLIQDVLDLSHVIQRPMVVASVDVDALVQALITERPEFSLPQSDVSVDGPLLRVLAHEGTLSQCLTNLLGNAVKFVEPGNTPRVRVWTENRIAEGADTRVRIWVADSGIGIRQEDQPRIFEIFERLNSTQRFEGSGIGLAIVRKAVERMGGKCGVESEPGKGSRFWLELAKG
jgi:signal transduction histidine kinase